MGKMSMLHLDLVFEDEECAVLMEQAFTITHNLELASLFISIEFIF